MHFSNILYKLCFDCIRGCAKKIFSESAFFYTKNSANYYKQNSLKKLDIFQLNFSTRTCYPHKNGHSLLQEIFFQRVCHTSFYRVIKEICIFLQFIDSFLWGFGENVHINIQRLLFYSLMLFIISLKLQDNSSFFSLGN